MLRLFWMASLAALIASLISGQTGHRSSSVPGKRVAMESLPPPKSDKHGHPADTRKGSTPCGSPKLMASPDCGGSGRSGTGSGRTGGNSTGPRDTPGAGNGNTYPPRDTPGGGDRNPPQPPRTRPWPVIYGVPGYEGLPVFSLPPEAAHNVSKELNRNGPQFPENVRMADFQVTGFAKARWPVVVDYEAEPGAYVLFTVVAPGAPAGQAVLPAVQTGRRIQLLRLPAELGTGLKPATFSIAATASATDAQPRYLRIYGFGAGDRAVGSVAIDELRFGPDKVTPSDLQTHFGFHTHTTFDKMKAEFMQVAMVDGSLEGQAFDNKKIDRRVAEGESINDQWSAKKAQPGPIQFRVRGWMTVHGDQGGDWVSAFSPDLVLRQ
jgi:hypothetical protein